MKRIVPAPYLRASICVPLACFGSSHFSKNLHAALASQVPEKSTFPLKYRTTLHDIGTKILFKNGFGHNSTHKAPPELIPELIAPKFNVESISDVKTRFKAIFKKLIFFTKNEIYGFSLKTI